MDEKKSGKWQAFVIGISEARESFQKVHLLEIDLGVKWTMLRKTAKSKNIHSIDLFQEIEIEVPQKNAQTMGFIKESHLISSFDRIPTQYQHFESACRLCKVIELNAQHIDDAQVTYQLLRQGLDAWNCKGNPEATYLKSLYLFANQEGYAVSQDWMRKLERQDREMASTTLTTPLEEISFQQNEIRALSKNLEVWLSGHHDFRF